MRKKFRTCWGQLCATCNLVKPFDAFDRQGQKSTGYRSHCKACRNAKYREKYATPEGRAYAQWLSWRNQGIDMDVDRYEAMLAEQMGMCVICLKTEAENGRRLCVDHDHATGAVRGLLCDDCNTGLGRFRDDVALVRKALDYLEVHSMKGVV